LVANRQEWDKIVKWVAIGGSVSPWLMVGKVNGGAPSNNIASVDKASIGEVLSANWGKALFCVSLE
jgi:hypothetical protein